MTLSSVVAHCGSSVTLVSSSIKHAYYTDFSEPLTCVNSCESRNFGAVTHLTDEGTTK